MPGGTAGHAIKVWRNMVPDISEEALDADAKGALAFIRQVFER